MKKLNLPSFDYKIKREGSFTRIFDMIRRKYVVLTPEEWVRQHFIHYLVEQLHYPRTLIAVESGLKYNQLQKRSDIVVYDKSGIPFLLVECKSANTVISKKELFQIATYNHSINARYIVITNGMGFFCGKTGTNESSISWLQTLPPFPS